MIMQNIPSFNRGEWPAQSCDAAVLDYFVWQWLSKEVYRLGAPTTVNELIRLITHAWQRLPQDLVRHAIDAIEPRLRRIIANGGGPIEKYRR
jgi:hypothetical protein